MLYDLQLEACSVLNAKIFVVDTALLYIWRFRVLLKYGGLVLLD